MSVESDGQRVVDAARQWIGTPYRHQGAVRGAGCDCLGLVRGVWRDLYGAEPEETPAYAADWNTPGEETLAEACARHLAAVEGVIPAPGDVILFRLSPAWPAKHVAIASSPDTMIHAYSGAAVAETSFGPWWRRRVALLFRFPNQGGVA